MKRTLNIKIVALALMLVIALAALGLVIGIVVSGGVAEAEGADGAQTEVVADEGTDGEAEETPAQPAADDNKGLIAIAAGIAIGLAAAAGAIGMGITIA